MKKQDWIVVNFSGGKDSTAMLLRMMELGEHIDEVVCCDTYKEFPAMYRHIEKVKKIVEDAGIKFTMLRSKKSFDYFMFKHQPKRKKEELRGFSGFSWAGPLSRWCTTSLKVAVIEACFRQLSETYNVTCCIGIATDEAYRLERSNNKQAHHRHPLVEWGWTEADALQYCYSKGFDWEGLYEHFKRVSCWCCPLQSIEDLRRLRKYFPDLWEELKDMDRRTWRNFRADYSVDELEIRFAFEEERLAEGLPINNRDFFNKLKERLKGSGEDA